MSYNNPIVWAILLW